MKPGCGCRNWNQVEGREQKCKSENLLSFGGYLNAVRQVLFSLIMQFSIVSQGKREQADRGLPEAQRSVASCRVPGFTVTFIFF